MLKVIKCHHASYFIEQKKTVVTYAIQHRRNAAGKHFELDQTMVGHWIKTRKLRQ
ncbi:19505_t:CDS:1, partial [Funneliformis geosporum]